MSFNFNTPTTAGSGFQASSLNLQASTPMSNPSGATGFTGFGSPSTTNAATSTPGNVSFAPASATTNTAAPGLTSFGAPSAAPATTTFGGFGTHASKPPATSTASTTQPAFGAPSLTSSTAAPATGSFGAATTSTTTPAFGATTSTTTAPSLGASTTSTSGFGGFGTQASKGFGASTSTTTGFGASTGTSSGFGTSTTLGGGLGGGFGTLGGSTTAPGVGSAAPAATSTDPTKRVAGITKIADIDPNSTFINGVTTVKSLISSLIDSRAECFNILEDPSNRFLEDNIKKTVLTIKDLDCASFLVSKNLQLLKQRSERNEQLARKISDNTRPIEAAEFDNFIRSAIDVLSSDEEHLRQTVSVETREGSHTTTDNMVPAEIIDTCKCILNVAEIVDRKLKVLYPKKQ